MKTLKFFILTLLTSSCVFLVNSCKEDESNSGPRLNFKGRWVGTYDTDGTSFFGFELNNDGELLVFASENYYYGSGTWSKNGKSFTGTYEYADFEGTWNLSAQLTIDGSDSTLTGTWTDASDATNTGSFSVVKNTPYPVSALTYQEQSAWACSGNDCQNVWEVFLVKGLTTVGISDLTDGAVGQIALYAPGTNLGGTNLLTGDTKELLDCTQQNDCDDGAVGVSKSITLAVTGLYKFAATRNNGYSCGSTGNFQSSITSAFPVTGNATTSNAATQASGFTCN
jgi:hypothetical protein